MTAAATIELLIGIQKWIVQRGQEIFDDYCAAMPESRHAKYERYNDRVDIQENCAIIYTHEIGRGAEPSSIWIPLAWVIEDDREQRIAAIKQHYVIDAAAEAVERFERVLTNW